MAGVYRGDHLAYVGSVGTGFGQDKVRALMPALKARRSRQEPVRRQGCAAQDARRALGETRAGRRDRVRRLDRRRQHPAGRVQGPARRTSRRDEVEAEKPAMTAKVAKPSAESAEIVGATSPPR